MGLHLIPLFSHIFGMLAYLAKMPTESFIGYLTLA